MQFPSYEEDQYDEDQIQKIKKVQQVFKKRKLIIEFDYFENRAKFRFQVYWLRTKRLLFFKIYIFGEALPSPKGKQDIEQHRKLKSKISYVNLNDETMMDHFHSASSHHVAGSSLQSSRKILPRQASFLIEEADKPYVEKSRQVLTERMIIFQNLKISMEEILPEYKEEDGHYQVKK